MNEMYELISERLKAKAKELKERQEQFDIVWNRERHSDCFERNAINDLLIMQQLKSEIHELEHWKTLIRVQIEK